MWQAYFNEDEGDEIMVAIINKGHGFKYPR
jgi:hypothetical protein